MPLEKYFFSRDLNPLEVFKVQVEFGTVDHSTLIRSPEMGIVGSLSVTSVSIGHSVLHA